MILVGQRFKPFQTCLRPCIQYTLDILKYNNCQLYIWIKIRSNTYSNKSLYFKIKIVKMIKSIDTYRQEQPSVPLMIHIYYSVQKTNSQLPVCSQVNFLDIHATPLHAGHLINRTYQPLEDVFLNFGIIIWQYAYFATKNPNQQKKLQRYVSMFIVVYIYTAQ